MALSPGFSHIGILKTCFTEKFGAPRQSGMIDAAWGVLKLNPDPAFRMALNHLDEFSHVWIVFEFHKHLEKKWRPTILPPRIGAPSQIGVFASRSPHRPNPIGLSAVKLQRIDWDAPGGIEIHLGGVDILDGTPVLDIKPYLPFADCIPEATGGWAEEKVKRYRVEFSESSLQSLEAFAPQYPQLKSLISQMLEWDPRPTSQRESMPLESPESEGRTFGLRLLDIEIQWRVVSGGIRVEGLARS